MERLRGYAIITMVGVLVGLGFLVEGCGGSSGSTGPDGQETSVVVICNPGDSVQFHMNLEGSGTTNLSDFIKGTTTYTGLRPGTWNTFVAYVTKDNVTKWKNRSVVLEPGQITTVNVYAE